MLDELAGVDARPRAGRHRPALRSSGARAGRVGAHVVTAAEEARYEPILVPRRRNAAQQRAAMSLLAAAVSVAMPELALLGLAITLTDDDDGAMPPATRAGDAVLCVPVETPKGAALVLAVVRDGRLLQRKVVRRAQCPG